MSDARRHDAWQAGESYDAYMGRWSREVAPLFLDWLDAPHGGDWLDVGCGTGALSAAVLSACSPTSLVGIDPSESFVAMARRKVPDARASIRVGDAQVLDIRDASRDAVVSGLVLNFVLDRPRALAEMRRVARPGARIGFYVWDYPGGGMEMVRWFWTAATALDPGVADLTEDRRFPFCTPDDLTRMVQDIGFETVESTAIEIATVFRDFEDYWRPFTLGAGPAPGYCGRLDPDARDRLHERLASSLPRTSDGSIPLRARAWAVKARAA